MFGEGGWIKSDVEEERVASQDWPFDSRVESVRCDAVWRSQSAVVLGFWGIVVVFVDIAEVVIVDWEELVLW